LRMKPSTGCAMARSFKVQDARVAAAPSNCTFFAAKPFELFARSAHELYEPPFGNAR